MVGLDSEAAGLRTIRIVTGLQRSHIAAAAGSPRRWGPAVVALAMAATLAAPVTAQPPRAPACADDPAFGWLDFWVGDWKVMIGGQQVGTNRIRKVLDGCAVTEEWTDARGREGRSLFYVSPGSGGWRQVWVTDTALAPGGVKEKRLIARFPNGALRFQGEIAAEGLVVLDRTTLTPLENGHVRQVIERSDDGGATWRTGFDAVYVPATAGSVRGQNREEGASGG